MGIYFQLVDHAAMACLVRKNLELNPSNLKAYFALSEALALARKLCEAEVHTQEALKYLYGTDYADPDRLAMIY